METKKTRSKTLSPRTKPELEGYEKVIDLSGGDPRSPLQGFIAIHNTFLGPAIGGTRIWKYQSKDEALRDALKLSEAMTYKCAIAGLPFGGGKGVMIYNKNSSLLKQILRSYAEKVSLLKGKFYTGEDVGLSEENVQYMLKYSDFFVGRTGQAGDPSKYAALSTFYSIKTALQEMFGSDQLRKRKLAVKGVGKTGSELVRLLYQEGADLVVTDTNRTLLKKILRDYPRIRAVPVTEIDKQRVDVFCPCALGNDITQKNITKLRTKIICGSANNQLESHTIADRLFSMGILNIPDYVANAGGLINVADELLPSGYNRDRVMAGIRKLRDTLQTILHRSQEQKSPPSRVADHMAEIRFKPHHNGLA